MDPVAALDQVAFQLERRQADTYRVRAYRKAQWALQRLGPEAVQRRADAGSLTDVKDVGAKTAQVAMQALGGDVPTYLEQLVAEGGGPLAEGGAPVRALLRGDLHTHSDWTDGGSPPEEMASTAKALGHDYVVLTDHSPRLTVARGLSPQRLREQLALVEEINQRLAPFRLLTGIEVDINEDGTLDQDDDLLAELDVVVASVHSKLAMEPRAMTRRMLAAVRHPATDVLGHCTGRLVGRGRQDRRGGGRERAQSRFDADAVFAACAEQGVAVEVNSRPERRDPPDDLLLRAVDAGCLFSIDSDAHAPGQLDFLDHGCARAVEHELPLDRVVNTWALDDLLGWSRG